MLEALENGLGYYAEHKSICYIAPHPKVVLDLQNRYHSLTSPAISWKNGLQSYFLDGTLFAKELWGKIVSNTLPAREALKIENQDQRAIAIHYLGGQKILKELGGKKFSEDEYGELWRLEEKDTNGKPYIYFCDGDPSKNGEKIYLRTHPDMKTPQEAMTRAYKLSRWGMTYQPSLRT
jgi:hypothetical protein